MVYMWMLRWQFISQRTLFMLITSMYDIAQQYFCLLIHVREVLVDTGSLSKYYFYSIFYIIILKCFCRSTCSANTHFKMLLLLHYSSDVNFVIVLVTVGEYRILLFWLILVNRPSFKNKAL